MWTQLWTAWTCQSNYEIARMPFQANAQPGAPGDPITRYEWDFDGDGEPEVAGPDAASITYQFHDADTYNGIVTVRDGDSLFDQPLLVEVRQITMLELIEFMRLRVNEELQAAVADGNIADVLPLADLEEYFIKAEWVSATVTPVTRCWRSSGRPRYEPSAPQWH